MECVYCNKKINNKLSFSNIFKPTKDLCENCSKFLYIHKRKFLTYNHFYFSNYLDVKDTIYNLKYTGDIFLAKKFSTLFKNFLKENNFDIITIVSSNNTREYIRTFNHLALLCKVCDINYAPLFKNIYRKKQAKLHKKRELHKIYIEEKFICDIKQAKNILIIDDIFTSGKTLHSCAKELETINNNLAITFLTLAYSNKEDN